MFVTDIKTDKRGLPILTAAVDESGTCRVVERKGRFVHGGESWTVSVEHPYYWSLEVMLSPLGRLADRWWGYVFYAYSNVKPVLTIPRTMP